MSTPVLDNDTDVVIDEQTDDAPIMCHVTTCENVAHWVPVCPNGHLLRTAKDDNPAYMCDEHAALYPRFLMWQIQENRITMACFDCKAILDGRTIPLP